MPGAGLSPLYFYAYGGPEDGLIVAIKRGAKLFRYRGKGRYGETFDYVLVDDPHGGHALVPVDIKFLITALAIAEMRGDERAQRVLAAERDMRLGRALAELGTPPDHERGPTRREAEQHRGNAAALAPVR